MFRINYWIGILILLCDESKSSLTGCCWKQWHRILKRSHHRLIIWLFHHSCRLKWRLLLVNWLLIALNWILSHHANTISSKRYLLLYTLNRSFTVHTFNTSVSIMLRNTACLNLRWLNQITLIILYFFLLSHSSMKTNVSSVSI